MTLHILAAQQPAFSLAEARASISAILLLAIFAVLGYLTLKALLGPSRSGDYSTVAKVVICCLLAMIPMALGMSTAIALGYGKAILTFVTGLGS